MTGDDELLQVEQVIERLITRYPSVSAADIEHTVRGIHGRFENGRIRDYVPLLVEKAARRAISDQVSETADQVPGAVAPPTAVPALG